MEIADLKTQPVMDEAFLASDTMCVTHTFLVPDIVYVICFTIGVAVLVFIAMCLFIIISVNQTLQMNSLRHPPNDKYINYNGSQYKLDVV